MTKFFIVRLLAEAFLTGFALLIGCYIIPGVFIRGDVLTALLACAALTTINLSIGLLLRFSKVALNTMTAGLLTLLINVFIVLLLSYCMPGFVVSGFFSAVTFAFVMGLMRMLFYTEPVRS